MYSRTRGYLPHITHPTGTYFVTFRLADSLPTDLLLRWKEELDLKRKQINDDGILKKLSYEYQEKVQTHLDTSHGHCWLKNTEIASLVDGALRYYNHQRYELLTWTIMPNHVHVLVEMNGACKLSSILHSWKSFTAHEANHLLSRTGEFWQREYFDRLISSSRQLEFVLRYILNNPVKAGLCTRVFEWPWSRCSQDMQPLADRFFLCDGGAGADAGDHLSWPAR